MRKRVRLDILLTNVPDYISDDTIDKWLDELIDLAFDLTEGSVVDVAAVSSTTEDDEDD